MKNQTEIDALRKEIVYLEAKLEILQNAKFEINDIVWYNNTRYVVMKAVPNAGYFLQGMTYDLSRLKLDGSIPQKMKDGVYRVEEKDILPIEQ